MNWKSGDVRDPIANDVFTNLASDNQELREENARLKTHVFVALLLGLGVGAVAGGVLATRAHAAPNASETSAVQVERSKQPVTPGRNHKHPRNPTLLPAAQH